MVARIHPFTSPMHGNDTNLENPSSARTSHNKLTEISSSQQRQIIQSIAEYLWCIIERSHTQLLDDFTFDEKMDIRTSIEIITQYIDYLLEEAQVEFECMICAMIYLDRLLQRNQQLQVTRRNWRNILATCALISSKVWDDFSMSNADFSIVFPNQNLREVNQFELHALNLLNFQVTIPISTYHSYCSQYLSLDDYSVDEIDSYMCDSLADSSISSDPSCTDVVLIPSKKSQGSIPSIHSQLFQLITKVVHPKRMTKQSKIYC